MFFVFADLVQALLFIYYNKIDLHLLSIKKDILKSNRDIIGFRSIITGNQIKDKFSQPVHTSSPTPNKWIHVNIPLNMRVLHSQSNFFAHNFYKGHVFL